MESNEILQETTESVMYILFILKLDSDTYVWQDPFGNAKHKLTESATLSYRQCLISYYNALWNDNHDTFN